MTLEQQLRQAFPELTDADFGYHYTDLYVVLRPGMLAWLKQNYQWHSNISTFVGNPGSNLEGKRCLDIPFAGKWGNTSTAGAKTTYTTVGPVRGGCGHNHRTIRAAADCCRRDQAGCQSQGGYSDRSLRVIEDGERREPTESEYLDFSDRLANH